MPPSGMPAAAATTVRRRSEEHTSELQSHSDLVCRLLLEKKKKTEHREKPTRDEARGARNRQRDGRNRPHTRDESTQKADLVPYSHHQQAHPTTSGTAGDS